jgi:hypothetical protein
MWTVKCLMYVASGSTALTARETVFVIGCSSSVRMSYAARGPVNLMWTG